jgi:hypothetical protein
MFLTYMTIAGTIFALALAGKSRAPILLVVPYVSFLVCARYVQHTQDLMRVGTYIREQLSPRLAGKLAWEEWIIQNPPRRTLPLWAGPLLLSFVGSAVLALAASLGFVFNVNGGWPVRVGLPLIWLVGLVLTTTSTRLILIRNRLHLRTVSQEYRRSRVSVSMR